MIAPTFWEHVLALGFGLVLPIGSALGHARRPAEALRFSAGEKIALYWTNGAALAVMAALALLAWRGAGRSLATLGLTVPPQRLDAGLALTALFLLLYGADTAVQLMSPERRAETRARWRRQTPFLPQTAREVRHSLALVVSAAVGEEIVFRGFLVAYVIHLLGPAPEVAALAVVAPAAVFALAHVYQGIHATLKIALLAGLFGAILVVTRSLWIPIALHLVVDLVGVALAPWLLGPPAPAEE